MIDDKKNTDAEAATFAPADKSETLRNLHPACVQSSKIEKKYQNALLSIPAPGGGGCHAALLGVANLGIMTGRNDNDISLDIRGAIPSGRRRVSEREISEAIRRARKDTKPFDLNGQKQRRHIRRGNTGRSWEDSIAQKLKGKPEEAAKIQSYLIEKGGSEIDPFGADIWESSPIRINAFSEDCPYIGDMVTILETLYDPDDLLYIGSGREPREQQTEHIKTASDWTRLFQTQNSKIASMPRHRQQEAFKTISERYSFIIPNPVTGTEAETQNETCSMRGNANIKKFKFMLLESDSLPKEKQIPLIRSLGLQVAAMIYTGGKSIHAWVRTPEISSHAEWESEIKGKIFSVLGCLGFDKATCNPARLSRLPGIFRPDKGSWQQLLYIAPERMAV